MKKIAAIFFVMAITVITIGAPAAADSPSYCTTPCDTIYVDLSSEQVPEGVWSNASALLLAEGWCTVIQRDQLWQQSESVSWQNGATEDFLLLCNPGPGARYYSLQDSFGGRPRDWWNDEAKAIWLFCLPGTIPVLSEEDENELPIAVLYEHDDGRVGWEFPILLK